MDNKTWMDSHNLFMFLRSIRQHFEKTNAEFYKAFMEYNPFELKNQVEEKSVDSYDYEYLKEMQPEIGRLKKLEIFRPLQTLEDLFSLDFEKGIHEVKSVAPSVHSFLETMCLGDFHEQNVNSDKSNKMKSSLLGLAVLLHIRTKT